MERTRMLARRKACLLLAAVAGSAAVAGLAALLGGCIRAPTVTPTPTKTPATQRVLTFTPAPTRVALATATLPAPTPTQAPSPTQLPTATATPLPPTATSTASPTTAPSPTPTATTTATATRTASPRSSATRPPAPPATAVPTASPLKNRAWDPRLTQRGATLIPAQVKAGQGYWRLVQAQWFDEGEPPFNGKHNIFVDTLDASGNRQTGVRIQMASLDLSAILGYVSTEAKPGEPYAGSFAMFNVAPAYRVEPAADAPADAVTGLGLGSITAPSLPTLTSYGFTWQWTVVR